MNETTAALESLSIDDLLRFEELCDQYEAACYAGNARSPDDFCQSLPEAMRPHVLLEVARIYAECVPKSSDPSDDTLAAADQSSIPALRQDSHGPFSPGSDLDQFQLNERLGSGACGTVWKARDKRLGRMVAIKIPHPELAGDSSRFAREAQLAAGLRHENIVRVFETGRQGAAYYIVSELIDGESLQDRLRREPLPVNDAVEIAIKVAGALGYAHREGVIHRDLKPHNVLLDSTGSPHISDFGLAKQTDGLEATLTRQGDLLGTPAYMAPEQARGESHRADERTDIYCLGVMLFQMLTGELPFRGRVDAVIHQVLHSDPPPPRKLLGTVPIDLETICLKCLEKDPTRRFQSADELVEELKRFTHRQPIRSRPLSPMGHVLKAARRHPRVAVMTGVLAIALVTIAVGATLAAFGIEQARQREHTLRLAAEESEAAESKAKQAAIDAGQRAAREAEISRQSAEFLQDLFQSADPVTLVLRGGIPSEGTPPITDTLARAARRIGSQFKEQPRVKTRLTMLLGNACRGAGMYEEADRLLREAGELRNRHVGTFDEESLALEEGENWFYQGLLAHDLDDRSKAEALYQQALARWEPFDKAAERKVAELFFRWASLKLAMREHAEAEHMFEQALAVHRKSLPENSPQIVACRFGLEMSRTPVGETPELHRLAMELAVEDWALEVARGYAEMIRLRGLGELAAACDAYAAVIEKLKAEIGERHPVYVLALGEYAGLLWEAGNYRKAYPAVLEAVERGRDLAPEHPKLRHALLRLAFEALRSGRYKEAEAYYREVRNTWHSGSFDFETEMGLMWTSFARGIEAKQVGDEANPAETHFRAALSHSERILQHKDRYMAVQTAWSEHGHAHILQELGKEELAEEFVEKSYSLAKNLTDWPNDGVWLGRMSIIASRSGDLELAERYARAALKANRQRFPKDHPRVADGLDSVGKLLTKRGEASEGEAMIAEACRIRMAQLPLDDARVAKSRSWLEDHGKTP